MVNDSGSLWTIPRFVSFRSFLRGQRVFSEKATTLMLLDQETQELFSEAFESGHRDCLMISSRNWRKKKRTERPSSTFLSFWMFLTRKGLLKHAAVCLHCFVGDRRATATPQNTCRRVLKCPTSGLEYHGIVSTEFGRQSILHHLHSFCIHLPLMKFWVKGVGIAGEAGRFFWWSLGAIGRILYIYIGKKNLQTFAKDLEDGS